MFKRKVWEDHVIWSGIEQQICEQKVCSYYAIHRNRGKRQLDFIQFWFVLAREEHTPEGVCYTI